MGDNNNTSRKNSNISIPKTIYDDNNITLSKISSSKSILSAAKLNKNKTIPKQINLNQTKTRNFFRTINSDQINEEASTMTKTHGLLSSFNSNINNDGDKRIQDRKYNDLSKENTKNKNAIIKRKEKMNS